MKKLFILIIALGSVLYGCSNEDDFDYDANSVVPVVQGFTGPTAATANGFGENMYSVIGRGGASYAFTVEGASATITQDPDKPYKATVIFAESAVDLSAYVFVVETAANGKSSEKDTVAVSLAAYCAFNSADLVGTTSGVDDCGYNNDGTTSVGATSNNLIINADGSGNPGLLTGLFAGWGETFQDGFGNDGDVHLVLNEDGSIEIPYQYFGQTLPGPYDYWIQGSGSFDQCKKTMNINYQFSYDDFSSIYRDCNVTLSIN